MTRSGLSGEDLELVAEGFNFPTSIGVGSDGSLHVAESGLPFGGAPSGGAVWRLRADGGRTLLAADLNAPVNGITVHNGALYVSEGGHPARLTRIDPDGSTEVLVDSLPGPGNYHLNMAVVGPDERLYFSQGAMTNSGIVGLDALQLGWLRRLPHGHDVPGFDITLTGFATTTPDPLSDDPDGRATTGAFAPFGAAGTEGRKLKAGLPATAAIMRCNLDGSELELVAWGLRNAYGLGFLPDGRLLAVDQGADDRGSRPIGNAPDALFEVRGGAWYGWPDFVAGSAITDDRFIPTRGERPQFLIADHKELPPPEPALLEFPPHVAAVKFDNGPRGGDYEGTLLIALFGDEAPLTGPAGPKVGRGVALIDTATWRLEPLISGDPLHRPIDVRLHDGAAYILDFGAFEITKTGVDARAGTGALWRLRLPG